ncbi:expressed protein, partial [Chlorella variabilis]
GSGQGAALQPDRHLAPPQCRASPRPALPQYPPLGARPRRPQAPTAANRCPFRAASRTCAPAPRRRAPRRQWQCRRTRDRRLHPRIQGRARVQDNHAARRARGGGHGAGDVPGAGPPGPPARRPRLHLPLRQPGARGGGALHAHRPGRQGDAGQHGRQHDLQPGRAQRRQRRLGHARPRPQRRRRRRRLWRRHRELPRGGLHVCRRPHDLGRAGQPRGARAAPAARRHTRGDRPRAAAHVAAAAGAQGPAAAVQQADTQGEAAAAARAAAACAQITGGLLPAVRRSPASPWPNRWGPCPLNQPLNQPLATILSYRALPLSHVSPTHECPAPRGNQTRGLPSHLISILATPNICCSVQVS